MKIAICDDDIEYINQIERLLDGYREENNLEISIFSSGEELLKTMDDNRYDLMFLDIEMKEISGIDVARIIKEKGYNAIIFFITNYTSYVSDTFILGAFQFLIKPINEKLFIKEFERALEEHKARHQQYVVRWKGITTSIKYSDICYIEVYDKHLYIRTDDAIYQCVGNLMDEYDKLKLYQFSRCHKGYIVNLAKIKNIGKQAVTMRNGDVVPIGRKFREEINNDFTVYLAGRMI